MSPSILDALTRQLLALAEQIDSALLLVRELKRDAGPAVQDTEGIPPELLEKLQRGDRQPPKSFGTS